MKSSPHVLLLLLHRQPGTPYRYIFALWRNSLALSVNLSHISSSLLLLSSHPAPAPLIRYTILALYKFICMYVCMYSCSFSVDRRSQLMMDKEGREGEEYEKEYEKQGKENNRNPRNLLKLALGNSYNVFKCVNLTLYGLI